MHEFDWIDFILLKAYEQIKENGLLASVKKKTNKSARGRMLNFNLYGKRKWVPAVKFLIKNYFNDNYCLETTL